MEFFNLRLKAKYTEFLEKEGWRNLSSRHGDEDEAEAELDGGGDDEEGGGTGNGDGGEGAAGSESEQTPAVKVDGQTVSVSQVDGRSLAVLHVVRSLDENDYSG